MPTTIMTGAGEKPKRSNGAPGRATPSPQRFRLLNPSVMSTMETAASAAPMKSILTSGRPGAGLSLKLRKKTIPATAIKRPKTGRQPIKVPSIPPIIKAATPAAARAEPKAPMAVACCWP